MQSLASQVMIAPEIYLSRATESLDDRQLVVREPKYLNKFANELVDFIGE